MKTQSVWNAYLLETNYPQLNKQLTADVTIIGGGITGITTAQLLSEAGLSVILLEARKVGGGTTSHSTGNLYIYDKYITHIFKMFGKEAAQIVVAERRKALELIEQNITKLGLDCDFQKVSWNAYSSTEEASEKIKTLSEIAHALELPVQDKLQEQTPYQVTRAVSLPDQAQFNPARYVQSLSTKSSTKVQIFENSSVIEINEAHGSVSIKTSGGSVTSKFVVHATHTPKGIMTVQTLLGPYREYGIACRIKEKHPPGIFWGYSTVDDLVSTRTYKREGQDYLVVVGHPHKVGQAESNQAEIQKLVRFAQEHFNVVEIDFQWGGQHYRPADHLPYIGRHSHHSNIFIATGFSTDGLTYGTVAAALLRDQILDRKTSAGDLFSPTRFTPLKSAPKFLKENLNVMKEYLLDLPGRADAKNFSDVALGQGKVIERDGQKLAVHKDENNSLHICSAVCTHMQCIVNWNDAEKSWDCPCHGSRFDTEGKVLEGPAITSLPKIVIEDDHVHLKEQL